MRQGKASWKASIASIGCGGLQIRALPKPHGISGQADADVVNLLKGRGSSTRSVGLFVWRRPRQFVCYVGEESPVEGVGVEEEKSSCSKRAILALLSCNSFKRFSLSSNRFSLASIRFSLARDSILSCSVSCSMS